jgi:hypothetical protein
MSKAAGLRKRHVASEPIRLPERTEIVALLYCWWLTKSWKPPQITSYLRDRLEAMQVSELKGWADVLKNEREDLSGHEIDQGLGTTGLAENLCVLALKMPGASRKRSDIMS